MAKGILEYCPYLLKYPYMPYVWDYDPKELKKTEKGRILLLERLINYGPSKKGEKIDLSLVKKYWNQLDLYNPQRHLLELILWGKNFLHPAKKSFSIK